MNWIGIDWKKNIGKAARESTLTFELDAYWDTRTQKAILRWAIWMAEWEMWIEREEKKPNQAERRRDFFVSVFILSIGSMCYHVWMLYISARMEQIHNGMEIFLFDCCTLTIDIIFFTQDLSYFCASSKSWMACSVCGGSIRAWMNEFEEREKNTLHSLYSLHALQFT